ncbi:SET domain-containing protein [Lentinula aciculospora]|uniref:SET domain-containing protein n=1 Tax=Lentinula aciculospora TaxID=153920 RepID=A0A9W9AS18_9AGAR|nr:SET domain-containing protein [Lentinula aciculospora]
MATHQSRWRNLLSWLNEHGMETSETSLLVERRLIRQGTEYYGLYTKKALSPNTTLFTVPRTALMNIKTLSSHYGIGAKSLSATQLISLHLLLHRPLPGKESLDPLFGPYISTLPRDFDYHPLSWTIKGSMGPSFELLPPSATQALRDLFSKFRSDLAGVSSYVRDNPRVLETTSKTCSDFVESSEWLIHDYLWAWLNVNTRCIYYQVKNSPADPDNITLCPILDFANHSSHLPCMSPPPPSVKRNFRSTRCLDLSLLSPSDSPIDADCELYLKYGGHCNRVLFAEYGFVLPLDLIPKDERVLEVNVDDIVETLFLEKGETGAWMKDVLVLENYWRDWTMHYASGSAFPSYRLVIALRLISIFPPGSLSPFSKDMLRPWKDVVVGNSDKLSPNLEETWRGILQCVCTTIVERASKALVKSEIQEHDSIVALWTEEKFVAERLSDLVESGETL